MKVVETTWTDAIQILEPHSMRYIPFLKHATMLQEHARYFKIVHHDAFLLLMTFANTQTHHDRQAYPHAASINILSGTYPAGIPCYCKRLVPGQHIIKSELDLTLFYNGAVVPIRTFYSFTNTGRIALIPQIEVAVCEAIPATFEPLFKHVGYALDDLQHALNHGGKVLVFPNAAAPRSGCLVFPIYRQIWEIGAVATLPEHRQHGFAKQVVAMANNDLLAHHLLPRYSVESTNVASVGLAQKLGFQKHLEFTHFKITIPGDAQG